MDTVRSRRRALARLTAVCAVLFGLFLMHGAPATAADSCHDAAPAAAPMHDEHVAHVAHAGDAAAMAPMAGPGPAHAGPPAMSGEHSAQCVATTARDRILLPTVWLLAVAVVAGWSVRALAGRRVAAGEAGRRGPPGGGRDLLLRVCISRT